MSSRNLVRFVNNLNIIIAVCALQLYAQSLDRRTPPNWAARVAAARRLHGRAVNSSMPANTFPLREAQGMFITFDLPGTTGTTVVSINPAGKILGYSSLSNGLMAAFLRDNDGTFNTFNVSGATAYTSFFFGFGPAGSSLNPADEATGGYFDANGTMHGFVRDGRGVTTTFDAPGADITPGDGAGTTPLAINQAGEITGYYVDADFFWHGFFRDLHGTVTDFDPPGASTACFFGLTTPWGINAAGEVIGAYYDSGCNTHGFLRERNGAVSVVDVPSFATFTVPEAINDGGEIAGYGIDATNAEHGFVRDNRGFFMTFDVPNVREFQNMDINRLGWLRVSGTTGALCCTASGAPPMAPLRP